MVDLPTGAEKHRAVRQMFDTIAPNSRTGIFDADSTFVCDSSSTCDLRISSDGEAGCAWLVALAMSPAGAAVPLIAESSPRSAATSARRRPSSPMTASSSSRLTGTSTAPAVTGPELLPASLAGCALWFMRDAQRATS